MKKQFLNLGKALSRAEQKDINGGVRGPITFDPGVVGTTCSQELHWCATNLDCCGYSEDEVYGYPTGTDVRCSDSRCITFMM